MDTPGGRRWGTKTVPHILTVMWMTMTKGRRSEWTPLAFPTCGDGTFGSFATCCDGHLPEYIPENTFYRLAMKVNSPVDPEDKDRWQITTQFGSKAS